MVGTETFLRSIVLVMAVTFLAVLADQVSYPVLHNRTCSADNANQNLRSCLIHYF